MSERTLYEGSITVASTAYTHYAGEDDEDDEEVQIEDLDVVVSRSESLSFTLDYPFDEPYEGQVTGSGGITLRKIIDAVRAGFRVMYEGASHAPIAGLVNEDVRGAYGTAVHGIQDLVIEDITLLEDEGQIEIGIGS
jgi:hypothetical protein